MRPASKRKRLPDLAEAARVAGSLRSRPTRALVGVVFVAVAATIGALALLIRPSLDDIVVLLEGSRQPSEEAADPLNAYSLHYQFDRLVFYPDLNDRFTHDSERYEREQWPLEIVSKWTSPPHACVSAPEHLGFVERVADELTQLIGITISVTAPCSADGVSDFVIAIAERERLNAELAKQGRPGFLERSECLALPFREYGVIYYVYIAVPKNSRLVQHCIVHEFMHGLGLFGHAELSGPSILGLNSSPQEELSISDKIIIRTLYDSRITPGMARPDALAVAREVIEELLEGLEKNGVEALYQRATATSR